MAPEGDRFGAGTARAADVGDKLRRRFTTMGVYRGRIAIAPDDEHTIDAVGTVTSWVDRAGTPWWDATVRLVVDDVLDLTDGESVVLRLVDCDREARATLDRYSRDADWIHLWGESSPPIA